MGEIPEKIFFFKTSAFYSNHKKNNKTVDVYEMHRINHKHLFSLSPRINNEKDKTGYSSSDPSQS